MLPIFDGHNDTLTRFYEHPERSFFDENDTGHLDLPRARKGGLSGGLFAIFTEPPPGSPERDPMYGTTFTENGYIVAERSPVDQAYAEQYTNEVIKFAYKLEAQANGKIWIVSNYGELEQKLAQGILTILLHLEGAEAIQPNLNNLEFYKLEGVRSIGLVWSRPNVFGYGVPFRFPGSPDIGDGLTDAGKALVRECNQLGIMVDLAHLNEKGFFDVARISDAPLVVTHADVHAICPSTRNLTDAQIDAVGASGGVIGINFETGNTHPQSSFDADVPLSQITRHIDYIAKRIGIDHVAFGSDFDGADMPASLKDAAGLPALIEQLRNDGYDQNAIEKIAYKNWLRVFKATWKD